MAMDRDWEELEAFFRRLETDPASIDVETLERAFQAIRRWMLSYMKRLQTLEERMAQLEAARQYLEQRMMQLEEEFEALKRRHEESLELLRRMLTYGLWWDLARGGILAFSSN